MKEGSWWLGGRVFCGKRGGNNFFSRKCEKSIDMGVE